MAKYQKFEELPVWQEAAKLYNSVLDLFGAHSSRFSPSFRNQLERAALSISNNIAEGFERMTSAELISFLAIARGSAGEVRSMIAVIQIRPTMRPIHPILNAIGSLAQSCARQITAWIGNLEDSAVKGKRHLSSDIKIRRASRETAHKYRLIFLRTLKPEHPLYKTPEARQARGEKVDS